MKIGGYKTHPVADVHRLLEGAELDALAASIRGNGQREPIWRLPDGVILDGRNRLRACVAADVEPRFRDYDGPTDLASLLAFSRDVNEARRHDSVEQRAMAAARAKPLYAKAAKERMAKGGAKSRKGATTVTPLSPSKVRASDEAGAHYGVSGRTVDRAETVLRTAAPEVVAAVDAGKLAVSAAADLAKLDPAKQRAVLERSNGRTGNVRALVKQVEKAEVAERLNAEPPPMPAGPFRVIVSDPPWKYEKRAGDATHRGDLPYPPMPTEEICALDVASLAHDEGCVLWLWTTNAFMRDAYRVLDAWGFEPKTILTWVKDRMVLGDWLRGQTEHCILAVRGAPVVTLTNQTTVLHGKLREHSRKPDEFYALVEGLCPGSKVEMFSREAREGWTLWGAETGKFADPR